MRVMYRIRGAALGACYLGADVLPNSALLTDAFSSLRRACGAAKRER
jgi:hypothetical protein